MKLYATNDVCASIRKAHGAYTHLLVNRGYETIRPVYFRSSRIADLPVRTWASWDSSTASQLERWRQHGGVLLDRDSCSDKAGPADVLVFVECPLTVTRIERSCRNVREYCVLPRPFTWSSHELAIDLRAPSTDDLRVLWQRCRGKRMTDAELSDVSGVPKSFVQYRRARFKPVEEWEIRPRLAPEFAGFSEAWAWVGTGRCALRKDVRIAGHKAALKEMALRGHIAIEKYHRYPSDEPNWTRLEARRAAALANLAEVRSLIESLADHPDA